MAGCSAKPKFSRPRSQLESPSRQPVLNRRCCLPCGMARSSSSSPTLEPSHLHSPPLPPTQTPANSSPTAAARLFSLASLLLVGGWALAAGGPPPVAAVIPNGFGTKPCPCRPHHPLHPQVAFCASDFALKVRFLRMTGEYLSSTMHLKRYWVSVKAVFRNSAKIPNLIPNRRMHLWIYGERDNCGHGIVVRYHGEANSIISREVHLKKLYLVTGKLEHGQPMLSVCSWIAQWPNKTMRKAIMNSELGSPVVTDQQARYLRHGTYARGCSKCRIEDRLFQPIKNVTAEQANSCSFDPSRDYFMCLTSFSYCAYYRDPYRRTAGCAWHTASTKRYKKCATGNLQIEAQRRGITR
ncbi:hypothetical protein BOX15_Mlig011161g2 [Macrostomum lignano]|uniref:NTR domain-containing protein n=1 Tax=Macrostomum lignano TaxID=282301 RepID=A0A267DXT8_9PLAT|nr:hypothetical protein BOX15_Mlig011161g2 [Macrostomum lignano]